MLRRTGMSRWWSPLLGALAVLALVGAIWAAAGSGGNDANGGEQAAGSPGSPGDVSAGSPGDTGAGDPGDPGGGGTDPDQGAAEPAPGGSPEPRTKPEPEPEPEMTVDRGVRIDSYYPYSPRRLALNYTIGVPACYGRVTDPRVEASKEAVTVTLTASEPTRPGAVCIEIALQKSVDIELDRPLGDRELRDGAFAVPVVVPRAEAPYRQGPEPEDSPGS